MSATNTETTLSDAQLDQLRVQAKALIGAGAAYPSQAAAARDAGIGESTFAAFLGGTYKGSNQAVGAEVTKWLSAVNERRQIQTILPVAPTFQMTSSAQDMLSVLQWAQTFRDFGLIVGGAGVSKTATCLHYAGTKPQVFMATMRPSSGAIGSMLKQIVRDLKIGERNAGQFSTAIVEKLAVGQSLLIIDEGQHLTSEALDELRTLRDEAKCGLILAGNESILGALEGGGRRAHFAPMFSRVGMRITITKPKDADISAMIAAWGVNDPGEVRFLAGIARKPGALRVLDRTMKFASALAVGAGEARSIDHIRSAYAQLAGAQEAA
ncbi:AAA family ATPase [Niveispirillum cyanobacteriorum]|uniref:Uncharacterized protein n=1 Tax=Niveispirillum cyanobacteriorum TaxID=1612173 RepID=A0A2K9NE53_9PROT|nr:AAA family ATPase [Niveispirillum cyanobacteriorum]AUN31272.1 hypothetical protein C0V82_14270 [Niveispirillum cyanobacteriorum]GGE72755.1 transposase [Niveispirillum cyanobacteriorum]